MTCDMRYGCEECKCPEIKLLKKEVERLEELQKEALMFMYRLVDKLQEEKKCR